MQSTVDDQILDEAKNHFEEGERYKALKLYEKALKQVWNTCAGLHLVLS